MIIKTLHTAFLAPRNFCRNFCATFYSSNKVAQKFQNTIYLIHLLQYMSCDKIYTGRPLLSNFLSTYNLNIKKIYRNSPRRLSTEFFTHSLDYEGQCHELDDKVITAILVISLYKRVIRFFYG